MRKTLPQQSSRYNVCHDSLRAHILPNDAHQNPSRPRLLHRPAFYRMNTHPFLGRATTLLAALYCLFAFPLFASSPVKVGTVIHQGFTAPLETNGWNSNGPGQIKAVLEKDGSVTFEVSATDSSHTNKLSRAFPISGLRGCTIRASARVRAENVSKRPQPWNGPKLLLQVSSDSGAGTAYPQANIPDDSFDWKEFSVIAGIPNNATSVALVIGLENVTGKISVTDLKVTVIEAPASDAPINTVSGPAFKGHDLPALRGAMVPITITPESLRVLGQDWNANLIRWQLGGTFHMEGLETPDYDAVLNAELTRFDAILPYCEQYGLRIVLDLHSLSKRLFTSLENQNRLVSTWQRLATRYKGRDIIWAYDIANEPSQSGWQEGALLWNDLATRVARAIREIDPQKPIIIEPELMAVPTGFESLRPVPVNNVIYSVHMYHPDPMTHNRVWDPNQTVFTYPGVIDGKYWDKAELERSLAPVIAFQKRYNVHIFVGEFGAVRWSPGAHEYLRDCIDIFESNNWDWAFHAFREWPGWSPEHNNDINDNRPSSTPTNREQLFRSWFARNLKANNIKTSSVPASSPVIKRMLFVGDSITQHAPAPELGWQGNWGMAASAQENDYVHRLAARFAIEQGSTPAVTIHAKGGGTIAGKLADTTHLANLAREADLIIVQLGENDHDVSEDGFSRPYDRLLSLLAEANPSARILCTGVWGPPSGNHIKDNFIRTLCANRRLAFADLTAANAAPENRALATGLWTHRGVNWHPSDAGMNAYAEAIWKAFQAGDAAIPAIPSAVTTNSFPTSPLLEESFASAATPLRWTPRPTVVSISGHENANRAMEVKTEDASSIVLHRLSLPLDNFTGRTVTVSARVKASNLSAPPKPWNGVKLMLDIQDAEGRHNYPQAPVSVSVNLDWSEIRFTQRIPENTVALALVTGLERVSGTLLVTDIRITAIAP